MSVVVTLLFLALGCAIVWKPEMLNWKKPPSLQRSLRSNRVLGIVFTVVVAAMLVHKFNKIVSE